MISFKEARALIDQNTKALAAERLDLVDSLGRVLADPFKSPRDAPFFDNSAVDGYAVMATDLESASSENIVCLPVSQVAAAGGPPKQLEAGHAARIFTGAPLPIAADSVVMQEHVEASNGMVCFMEPVKIGTHVRKRGEALKKGDLILREGQLLDPAAMGIIASLGLSKVEAFKRPQVAVIGTGSELIEPGLELLLGQIYQSNVIAVASAVLCAGGRVGVTRTLPDDKKELKFAIEDAVVNHDVLITCGGVSVGAHDFVRPVFESVGLEEIFWRVAIKPGKPIYFGRALNGTLVFGLPGNPVSALVCFFLFVRPALRKLQGLGDDSEDAVMPLAKPLRHDLGRHELARGRIVSDRGRVCVEPLEHQGSHMLVGLVQGDCLIHLPADVECFAQGEQVLVTKLQWGLMT